MKSRKTNWIGCMLSTNCLLKQDNELRTIGKVPGVGRTGKRRKQLLDNRKKTTRYSKMKQRALHRTLHCSLWRISFGRNNGPRARQTHTDLVMIITHSVDRTSRVEISQRQEKSLRTLHQ